MDFQDFLTALPVRRFNWHGGRNGPDRKCAGSKIRTVHPLPKNDNAFLSIRVHPSQPTRLVQGLLRSCRFRRITAITFFCHFALVSISSIDDTCFSHFLLERVTLPLAPCRRTSRRLRTGNGEERTFASPATAFASGVLPVLEGRQASAPFGICNFFIFFWIMRNQQSPVKFLLPHPLRQHLQI